jgi:ubiquinone/menaquinone biosynthesis C-methylase UbiE
MPDDVYTHGHHDSVLQSHRWRTAANSAGYAAPLHPGDSLLDVGCGPGTITAALVAAVAPGRVVAIDRSADVLEARTAAPGADVRSETSTPSTTATASST